MCDQMSLSLFVFSLQVGLCFAFLLDTSTKSTILGQSSLTDRHFVTVIELLSEEKQMRHQLGQFVTQLQQEMLGLKQQINSKSNNKTTTDSYISMIRECKSQITELSLSSRNLSKTISVLNHKHVNLQTAFDLQMIELNKLKNESIVIHGQLYRLQSLQSVHQLQDLENLKNDLTALSTKTDTLSNRELARQQDLIALYNEMKTTKNDVVAIDKRTNSFQAYTNHSLTEINLNTQGKLDKLDQRLNETLETVYIEGRKVAFTSCGGTIVGRIIKFPSPRTYVGVNLSTFKRTGMYTCEYAGLYHISVSIMSSANDDQFVIYKNGHDILHTYTAKHDSHQGYHMSTGVVAIELDVNDAVHVDTNNDLASVYPFYSCLTIIKVH